MRVVLVEKMVSDLISDRRHIYWNDQLLLALGVLAGVKKHSPYRLPVVDSGLRVKGIITGRRVLEILIGSRATSLRRSEGIRGLLREKVGMFCDEAHNLFSERLPIKAVAVYMAENSVGKVFVIDERSVFKGAVDEFPFLEQMRGKVFNIRVGDVMSKEILTVSPEAEALKAAQIMTGSRHRRLSVVINGRLTGVVTITDILHHFLAEEGSISAVLEDLGITDFFKTPVREVMQSKVAKIDTGSDLGDAAARMLEKDVSALMVTSGEDKLEGIVSRIDLISGLAGVSGVKALVDLVS